MQALWSETLGQEWSVFPSFVTGAAASDSQINFIVTGYFSLVINAGQAQPMGRIRN